MKKFNNSQKLAGEMAIRSLSDKAAEFYNGADPLDVFEYEEEDGEEIRRVTVSSWDGIKSGETVETGYSGQTLTAPTEPGTYRLYQEVYSNTNTHAGWLFEKIGE